MILRKIFKRRHGMTLVELLMVVAVLTILIGAGMAAFPGMQDSAKRSTARTEVDALSKACMSYMNDLKAGTAPTTLGSLVGTVAAPAIAAANSNDGMAKVTYVKKTGWTTDPTSFTDPWGNAYVYDAANQTITCTMNGGTSYVQSF